MADQKVEVEFAGKSNIDEVVKKAQSSMTNMEKNIDGINKKFQSFGKDLFLSVLGPMAIFNTILNEITSRMEEVKAKAKESFDMLAKGELKGATPSQTAGAQYVQQQEQASKNAELLKLSKRELAERYLKTDEGKKMMPVSNILPPGVDAIKVFSSSPQIQEMAMKALEKSMKDNPANGGFKPEGTEFKAPEGFSNVVGVGANPVMEAMASQLEEQRKQTDLLQQIANGRQSSDPIPTIAPAPSRASMLLHL
jgi:hypothetical protein